MKILRALALFAAALFVLFSGLIIVESVQHMHSIFIRAHR